MKRTLSIAKGKGSIGHNLREFTAENVDSTRTKFNTCYVHEDIQNVYHKLFDTALEEYNAKQKRNDRKIPDYYEKIRTSKQEKPFYEIIAQVGNFEDMNATTDNGKLAEEILHKYMADFQKRNPTLYVFSAHLHMDEATPHLHIDFVPYTTGNKRGLETKTTLKGALEKLGFTGGTRSDTELNQWQNKEKEKLAEIMREYGIQWDNKGTHKEHLSVLDYKKEMRSQEVAELDKKLETSKRQLQAVSSKKAKLKKFDDITAKPALLDGSKIVVDKDDFDELKVLAKKQVVAESKEKKLTEDNKQLAVQVQELQRENQSQKTELNSYKSIKNRLSAAGVEAELSNIKKLLNRILEFVEKLGLKTQLERFLNQKMDKVR